METSLYRYFSGKGVLLYVGISRNPFNREAQHSRSRDTKIVATIKISWYPDLKSALDAERLAVQEENPLWNKQLIAKRKKTPEIQLHTNYYVGFPPDAVPPALILARMTQDEFAEYAGVNRMTISRYVNGEGSERSGQCIAKAFAELGVTYSKRGKRENISRNAIGNTEGNDDG